MACYSASTEGEEALSANATETVLQLRGAVKDARIVEFGISFDGTSPTQEPILVGWYRQSSDGTSSAATEKQFDLGDAAPDVDAFHSFSAEPTTEAQAVWGDVHVHPQGSYVHQFPEKRELVLRASERLALVVKTPANVNPNVSAWVIWEE